MNLSVDQLHFLTLNVGFAQHNGDWNWKHVRSPFARLYYVTEGEAQVEIGSACYKLTPNHLYFIPAFTEHNYVCQASFSHYYIHIYEDQQHSAGVLDEYSFPIEVDAQATDLELIKRLSDMNPFLKLPESNPQAYDNQPTLASSFGVNLGTTGVGTEALFPTLYPDLMNSVDFKTSLFDVPVTIEGNKEKGEADKTMTYYDYLSKGQKAPWWSEARKAVFSIFGSKEEEEVKKVDPFRLTKEQDAIVKAIDKNVVCDVDKKTMVITINVTDQNAVIAAKMADTVKTRLQNFITEYRTSKARVDLEYNKKIAAETKARYDKARRLYAEYYLKENGQNYSQQKCLDYIYL